MGVADLTFPDDEEFIAEEAEFFEIAFVASNISPAFILPEIGICSRDDLHTLAQVDYNSGESYTRARRILFIQVFGFWAI